MLFQRIKSWWRGRSLPQPPEQRTYSYEDVIKFAEKYGVLRYNEGKRDGLTIAREQANKSLKEILWHQNKTKK